VRPLRTDRYAGPAPDLVRFFRTVWYDISVPC
jgi:hypothetical protein